MAAIGFGAGSPVPTALKASTRLYKFPLNLTSRAKPARRRAGPDEVPPMPDAHTILDPAVFLPPLAGGMMIGLGAALMVLFLGRVTGVSGIVAAALTRTDDVEPANRAQRWWRPAFLIGLIAAAPLYALMGGNGDTGPLTGPATLGIAGLLVGLGAAIGSGCTSGHGVCGMARMSGRSLVATCVFMTTAALTVLVTRHLIGG